MGKKKVDYEFVEAKGVPAGSIHSRRDTLGRPIERSVYGGGNGSLADILHARNVGVGTPAVFLSKDGIQLDARVNSQAAVDAVVALADARFRRAVLTLDLDANQPGMTATAAKLGAAVSGAAELIVICSGRCIGNVAADIVGEILSPSKARAIDLNMSGRCLIRQGARPVTTALEQLKGLQRLRLDLGWNSVGPSSAMGVSSAILKHSGLRYLSLNLAGNKIPKEGIQAVADAIGRLKECTELEIDLRSNLLQIGTGRVDDFNPVVLLWEGVRKMTKLSILRVDLRNCVLTDASIEPIAAALQRMSLEELQLDLRNNKIRDEGAKQVAQLPRICAGTRAPKPRVQIDLRENLVYKSDWGPAVAKARSTLGALDSLRLTDFSTEASSVFPDEDLGLNPPGTGRPPWVPGREQQSTQDDWSAGCRFFYSRMDWYMEHPILNKNGNPDHDMGMRPDGHAFSPYCHAVRSEDYIVHAPEGKLPLG